MAVGAAIYFAYGYRRADVVAVGASVSSPASAEPKDETGPVE